MAIRYQMTAKNSHERKNDAENQNIVQLQESSIRLVRKSFTYLKRIMNFRKEKKELQLYLDTSILSDLTMVLILPCLETILFLLD